VNNTPDTGQGNIDIKAKASDRIDRLVRAADGGQPARQTQSQDSGPLIPFANTTVVGNPARILKKKKKPNHAYPRPISRS